MSKNKRNLKNKACSLNGEKLKSLFSVSVLKRIEILRKLGFYKLPEQDRIKFLEKIGWFDVDINLDPPTRVLLHNNSDLDYLKENEVMQYKYNEVNNWASKFIKDQISSGTLVIDKIDGLENIDVLNKSDQGAIITVNHFNPIDTFSVEEVLHMANINKDLYKVIREGNFTNFPEGPIADYFKFGRTLPLSQSQRTMEMFETALKTILQRGEIVLVCPEQSMWIDYQKPKPMKFGAFKWATENAVPVIPMFIAHRSASKVNLEDNLSQIFSFCIGKPIYPNLDTDARKNIVEMRNRNFEFSKKAYEYSYKTKLEYDTDVSPEYLRDYIKSIPDFENMIVKKQKTIEKDCLEER